VTPDALTLNCVVEAKAQHEGTQQARETLKLVLSQHPSLRTTAHTYVALMRPSEKTGDKVTAFELYNEALEQQITPHIDLFNSLIGACSNSGDWAAAEAIFDDMREKGVKPKSASYLRYIYAAFRQQQVEKAYEMLVSMENEWRVPDTRDYQRMLTLFKRENHVLGKRRCIQGLMLDMKMDGDTPVENLDPEIISSLFKQAQENGQPEEVVQLAEMLAKNNVKLDRFHQVGVIFAHFQLNQAVPAFASLIELYESGAKLPERAYDNIAERLARQASSVDECYFLLESRKNDGRSVPLAAVNMVIEACAMMADLDRAFATWAELEQFGLKPNSGTFNALLHTCVRTRELASGRRLLARMAQDEVVPDAITFMHRCSLHIMSREIGLAMSMLDHCKEANLVPTGRMYASLINAATRNRRGTQAKALLESMRNDGHPISANLQAKVDAASSG